MTLVIVLFLYNNSMQETEIYNVGQI